MAVHKWENGKRVEGRLVVGPSGSSEDKKNKMARKMRVGNDMVKRVGNDMKNK